MQQNHQSHTVSSTAQFTSNNMKFIAFGVLLCALWALCSEAAIARVDFSNPDYPGKCVLNANTIMSPGQTGKAPNNPCAGVTCLENGKVEIRTCTPVAPEKGCKIRDFVNINLPFPACCERTYDCSQHI